MTECTSPTCAVGGVTWISNIALRPCTWRSGGLEKRSALHSTPAGSASSIWGHRSCWERVEFCRILTVTNPPVVTYYSSLVVEDRPGAGVVHVGTLEFVIMALARFLHAAERGIVGLKCYELWKGQGGCAVLVTHAAGVRRAVDH